MKKLLIVIILLFVSTSINAQMSGGQIKRVGSTGKHIKKQNSKETPTKSGDKLEEKYKNMTNEILEEKADQGDVMAQFYLGYNYAREGEYTIAITWFKNAAGKGLVRAQLWLAYCYYYGKGCDKDWFQAKQWLNAAAKHGSEDAKEYLNTWFK